MVIKRAHTAANVAPAIRTLFDGFNAAYPNRSKVSDGIWPSAAHTAANPSSDHEAGNAGDLTDALGDGIYITREMARRLSEDVRCNYVIHERYIFHDGVAKAYSGSNPHTGHAHVSVWEDKRGDDSPWDIGEEADVLDYFIIPVVCETAETLAAAKAKCDSLGIKKDVCGNALYAHANKTKGEQLQAWVRITAGVGSLKGIPTNAESAAAMGLVKDVRLPSCDAIAADLATARDRIARAKVALG